MFHNSVAVVPPPGIILVVTAPVAPVVVPSTVDAAVEAVPCGGPSGIFMMNAPAAVGVPDKTTSSSPGLVALRATPTSKQLFPQ